MSIVARILFVSLFAQIAMFDANAASGADWRSDVREIASFRGNEVRRWDRNPNYLYLGDEEHLPGFLRTVEMINRMLAEVTDIQLNASHHVMGRDAIDSGDMSSERRYPVNDLKEGFEISLVKKDEKVFSEQLDILVAVGTKATTLKLAFDFLKRDALTTEYARGNVPCFFGIFSDETSIKFGYVLINSDDDPSIIEACFYEELMQTLGLPRDAQGSDHFTFDNRAGERRTEQDSILVKTLYGDDVLYGDSVETLIRAMERSSLFR